MRQRRMVSFRGGQGGSRTAPTGGGESRLGGGCAFRRDGFLPPQERRWGVTVWGGPRSTLRSASADLQQAQGERPLPKDGFRLGGGGMTRGGVGPTVRLRDYEARIWTSSRYKYKWATFRVASGSTSRRWWTRALRTPSFQRKRLRHWASRAWSLSPFNWPMTGRWNTRWERLGYGWEIGKGRC